MAFHGIKTNIAVNLAILLGAAMLLTDFVMIIIAQRDLVRAEHLKRKYDYLRN